MCEPFEGWIMYRCTTWKTTSPSPWRVLLFNPPEGNHCLELIKNIHHSSCIGPIQVTSWEITQTELGPFFPEWGPFIWENCTGLVPFVRFPEPFFEVPYFVLGTLSYWLKKQWKEETPPGSSACHGASPFLCLVWWIFYQVSSILC